MSEDIGKDRIIPLTRKRDWQIWSGKFLANARTTGYKKVIEGDESAPAESVQISLTTMDANEKELLRKRRANDMDYNALIQSMDMPMAFQ